jgi:hypothetical protein
MIYQANGQLKQTGVAILISHKIDIKSQLEETKKHHFILIKGTT